MGLPSSFIILGFLAVLWTGTTMAQNNVNSKELCLPGNKHNNNLRLTGYNGTLKTPLKYYPPDLTCIWVITVPEGKVVKLFFIKFDLDWRGGDSCDDYVEVQDGQYASSKMLKKHCGYDYVVSAPKAIVSSGRYMRVKFSSDGFNAVRRSEGLVATFKAVNKSSTSPVVIGVIVTIVVLAIIIGIVFIVKRRKTPNREAVAARIPMAIVTTSASHTTHSPASPTQAPADAPYTPPAIGVAPVFDPVPTEPPLPPPTGVAPVFDPVPTEPPPSPPAYPYPETPPPPYPGVEGAPQFPPPGQSYPWLQASLPQHT